MHQYRRCHEQERQRECEARLQIHDANEVLGTVQLVLITYRGCYTVGRQSGPSWVVPARCPPVNKEPQRKVKREHCGKAAVGVADQKGA